MHNGLEICKYTTYSIVYNIHILYIFDTCKKIETQNFTCPNFDQNFKEKVCDVRDVSDTYMYIQTHTCIATSYRMVQNHKYFLVCSGFWRTLYLDVQSQNI